MTTTRPPTPDILGIIMDGVPVTTATPAATLLALSAIVNDGGTQMRAGMNADTVKEYEDALSDADAWPFPPVIVYHDGARYWLADGFHRLNAAHRSGKFQEIPADIKPGTRRDAVLFAAGANASHGLRRTNDDKNRSVKTLLEDDEWSKWSDREIARRCKVDNSFVSRLRAKLSVDHPQITTERTVERNGQTYQQNPANIGANRPAQPVMLAVWELQATVRDVYSQVYGGNPEPYATRDMRTGAQMRAGRFWLLCTQSLPANQFRLSDLAQAINNVAAQVEAQRDGTNVQPNPILRTYSEYRPTVPEAQEDKPLPNWAADGSLEDTLAGLAEPEQPVAPAGKILVDYTEEDWEAARIEEKKRIAAATVAQTVADVVAVPATMIDTYELRVYVRGWLETEWLGKGRTIPENPAHTNGTLWRELSTWMHAHTAHPWKENDLKEAIKYECRWETPIPPVAEPVEATPVSQRADYESDEWYTPTEYIEAARLVMGAIELDPATSEMAQTVVRAHSYLTRFDDGLTQTRWIHQRIWLNPPYSNPAPWVEKLVREHQAGPFCTEAIVLVNNATETSWFQMLLERFPVCLPARRIAFWRHDHANVGARQGQAFFYLGPNVERFQEIFSEFGPILRRLT